MWGPKNISPVCLLDAGYGLKVCANQQMANNISKTGISKCYQDGPTTFEYNILQKHKTLMVVNEERQDEKRAHNLTFWI